MAVPQDRDQLLRELDFGRVDAESVPELNRRFVRTGDFDRFLRPDVQLVLGAKGTGKSALFELFAKYQEAARGLAKPSADDVIVVTGMGMLDNHEVASEDVRELSQDGNYDRLWHLYIALKVALSLEPWVDYSKGDVREILRATGQMRDLRILPLLRGLWRHVVSGETPSGISVGGGGAKIELQGLTRGKVDVVELLRDANHILSLTKRRAWVLFDKVDELSRDRDQRRRQIEGLLARTLMIPRTFPTIQPRIFLRTDLWAEVNFTNKSHFLGKTVELSWSPEQLALLLVKGASTSRGIRQYLSQDLGDASVSIDRIPSAFLLRALSRLLPEKVYPGKNEPGFLAWLYDRVTDAHRTAFPRESILLANYSAEEQLRLGGAAQPGIGASSESPLVGREAVRIAFRRVSEDRCRTYFAEFPHLRPHFDRFQGKTSARFTRGELETMMRGLQPRGLDMLRALHDVGVLKPMGADVSVADQFEVPRLYRQGLRLVIRGRP